MALLIALAAAGGCALSNGTDSAQAGSGATVPAPEDAGGIDPGAADPQAIDLGAADPQAIDPEAASAQAAPETGADVEPETSAEAEAVNASGAGAESGSPESGAETPSDIRGEDLSDIQEENSPDSRSESWAENPAAHSGDAAAPAPDPEVVAAHNRFGYLLFADVVTQVAGVTGPQGAAPPGGTPRNVVLSPVSVALALAMAENGAAGETARAMAGALQHAGLLDAGFSEETLNRSNLALIDSLAEAAASGDIRLRVANALWHRHGLPIAPGFSAAVERYYRAELAGLDFAAPESTELVNAWAREATEGLIPSIVDELSDDIAALIANAVYFQGDWQTPFDSGLTRPAPFRLPSGERPEVPMMRRSGSIEYYEADFQAIRLPYGKEGRTAMYVFLPPEGESIEAFAARFEEAATAAFGNFRPLEGDVWLPRLDVSFKSSLNEPLQRLGMQVAFNPAAADFGRMVEGAGPGDLFIGNVLHQAVLKMDETGTEAAAVTTVEIRLTSFPVRRFSFRADRPFLLAIRDDGTGALLFLGAIVDPRGS